MRKKAWFFAGLAAVMAALAFLELRQPYYFTRDDNFAGNLPVILQGCRVLLGGHLLDWSPYQFLGAPVAATGGYTLTYPPTFLSYLFARYALGNELLTIEVFCILHLTAGYCAAWALLRRIRVDPAPASAGSLAFVLSGYSLIAGRSWFTMTAACFWTPLLFLSAVSLCEKRAGWKWIFGTGCILGFFYHAGHPQMWLYAVLFFLFYIAVLALSGKIPFFNAANVIPAFLFGAAVIMPLLIPQISIINDVIRVPRSGGTGLPGLAALFLPWPLAHAPHPESGWGTAFDRVHMTPLFYSGTVFAVVWLAGLVSLPAAFMKKKRILAKEFAADNIWSMCALIAFLMLAGKPGALWILQSKLPLLNRFTMSFKFIHFFNFFSILAGGTAMMRWLHSRPFKIPGILAFLSIGVYALIFYHTGTAAASFYTYADRPVSRLPSQITKIMNTSLKGRVLSLCSTRSPRAGYVYSFRHNFPSYFNVCSFGGYDPFIGNTPYFSTAAGFLAVSPLEAARAYGVQWVVVQESTHADDVMPPLTKTLKDAFLSKGAPRLASHGLIFVELDDFRPLVYETSHPRRGLPFSIRHDGLEIDVRRLMTTGGSVVINTLWSPGAKVVKGRGRLYCRPDRWGRVLVDVPPRTRAITFSYCPPWKKGFIAGALCLAGAVCSVLMVRKLFHHFS